MILDIKQIQTILLPFQQELSRVVWPAWDRYLQIDETIRFAFDSKTEANALHRLMKENAERELVRPGVSFLRQYGFCIGIDGFPFGVDGTVVCRLKRLDANGKSRSYPTERAKSIANNSAEIEGLPPNATILDVGYVMNDLGTAFADAQVVRVAGTAFVMSLPKGDAASSMPMPLFPDAGSPAAPRFAIVRPAAKKASSE